MKYCQLAVCCFNIELILNHQRKTTGLKGIIFPSSQGNWIGRDNKHTGLFTALCYYFQYWTIQETGRWTNKNSGHCQGETKKNSNMQKHFVYTQSVFTLQEYFNVIFLNLEWSFRYLNLYQIIILFCISPTPICRS